MDYKKVIEDFNNGVIDKSKWVLVMDNDGGFWSYLGKDYDNEDKLVASMNKKYGHPNGYQDIVDVLNAAGVPTEWC